jgi:hypothetical protein
MNAIEKYTAKKKLTAELMKTAQWAALKTALRSAGTAVKKMKLPVGMGARLGGKTLGQVGAMGKRMAMANPVKTGLGLTAAGFLAGRMSK